MPMSGSRRRSTRASCPARACWSRPGRSSRPAATGRKDARRRRRRCSAPRRRTGRACVAAVRRQIGGGADVVKFYADYRWRPASRAGRPSPSRRCAPATAAAHAAGRTVAAHASSPEGMRRAILAGVDTIEHGNGGTAEIFRLMQRARRRALPDAGRDRRHRPLSRLERRGARARRRCASNAPASPPRWRPA